MDAVLSLIDKTRYRRIRSSVRHMLRHHFRVPNSRFDGGDDSLERFGRYHAQPFKLYRCDRHRFPCSKWFILRSASPQAPRSFRLSKELKAVAGTRKRLFTRWLSLSCQRPLMVMNPYDRKTLLARFYRWQPCTEPLRPSASACPSLGHLLV